MRTDCHTLVPKQLVILQNYSLQCSRSY